MSGFDRDILGRLSDVSEADLNAALAAIKQEADTFHGVKPSQAVADTLKGLSEANKAVKAELANRAALAESIAADLASLTEAPEPEPVPAPREPAPQVEPSAPAEQPEDDKPADDGGDDTGTDHADTDTDGDSAVTAAARRPLGSNNKGSGANVRKLPQANFRTTAATNIPDVEVGTQFNEETLLKAFHDRISATIRRNAASVGSDRYEVATVRADYDESRVLTASAKELDNYNKINTATREARSQSAGQNALTAAGLCAPLETLYDIEVIGDSPRPVRDALVRFQVDRGGITHRPAFEGVTQTGGINVWTEANDIADPLVPKTCVEIACPDLDEAQVDAIYQCLTFSNMTTRFDPEFMAAVIRAQDVAHARFAENRILTQIITGSKSVYSTKLLGAVRDTVVTLDKMIAYYRNYHRLADETPLRLILPLWAKYFLRADLARQMVGDGLETLAVPDARITSWFTDRNVNVTWHLDGIDPADLTVPEPDVVVPAQFYSLLATGSIVPPFPSAISGLLFREGDWLYLDGGTLDLGTVRDSTLNGTNRFQTFSESFEGTAFRGIESFQLVIQTEPIGGSAATINTAAVTD